MSFNNPDDIGRFFNARSNQSIKFEIYGGEVKFEVKNKKFVVLRIFECKNFIPIICTQDFRTRERQCRLIKGTLYIRSHSEPMESREIYTREEWGELILRLLRYKEEILHKDLIAICKRVKLREKIVPVKKIGKKSEKEYERFLKRDKLI